MATSKTTKTAKTTEPAEKSIDPRLMTARQTPSVIAQAQVRNGMTQAEIDDRLWNVIGGRPAGA